MGRRGWKRVTTPGAPGKSGLSWGAVGAALLLAACDEGSPSMLDSQGPGAARIEGLWWLMLWISVVVMAIVLGFLILAVVKGRRADAVADHRARWGEPFIVVAGVIIPAVVLTAVFALSLRDMAALAQPDEPASMTVEVVGHDWWWEARYDGGEIVTANEIHIPVGQPVRFELTTDDVLHSFWVPQLQAKTDMVPGRVNHTWLEADSPGRYRGQCAEFCGLQHAKMAFFVVAQSQDDFDAWMEEQSVPAQEPVDAGALAGREVFLNSTCAGCHAIDGTPADADVGPDLTHLASRDTIAAGVLDNNRSNLEQFVSDPQSLKPGAIMPPTELSSQELQALVDYLEQLE
ncbi:MAG: cytochrome c oxidase subunit II [Actinomycetota bacterium]|nr:cytochrome c oxidase subunit II [Actinomycetota bacterium]